MQLKTCSECRIEKIADDFYWHPQTRDKLLPRCKECIKKWRKTERELSMARVRDKKRLSDPKRKAYARKHLLSFRERNPEKYKAQCLVNHFFSKYPEFKEKKCRVCDKECLLHYHHFNYEIPNNVIPCCPACHSKFHRNLLEVSEELILILNPAH